MTKTTLKIFTILVITVSFSSRRLYAQKNYTFNSPGSDCYLKFIGFAPNKDYELKRRPYIYILGEPGSSAMEVYLMDSLRNRPEFYEYMFVYVPNSGGTTLEKLNCFLSFVPYNTFHYAGGRRNVFLYTYDKTIQDFSSVTTGIYKVFASAQVAFSPNDSLSVVTDIAENFKKFDYAKLRAEKQAEELGTFYVDESLADEKDSSPKKIQKKTYFGPPKSYNFTFSGRVLDRSTGEALPFATVVVKGSNTGVSTNMDGYFTIPKVPSDTSVILISYLGYEKHELFLTPFIPKSNYVIEVAPLSTSIGAVTVEIYKPDVVISDREDVSVIKMTPKQLEKLPSFGEKDVMRSLQLMPGVSGSQESSSGLYVRGGTPDQNLILFDGFTVYHVDHLYGFFSAFNSNTLKDIQLYKGGFESRFGGRLSSVTELTGKDGNQKKFRMGGDLSLLSVNAFMEIPVGEKFSSIVAFRRSFKGPIYNKLFEKFNGEDENTTTVSGPGGGGPPGGGGRFNQQSIVSNYFYDLNGKFTFRPNEKNTFSWSIFNGTDKLDNSSAFNAPSFGSNNTNFSSNITDLTKYGNVGSSLRWSRKWSEKFYGNTILSYSNYYSDRNRSQERTIEQSNGEDTTISNGVFEKNNLKDYSIKSNYEWDLFNFSKLQFGGFGTYYDIHYSYAQNDTTLVLDKLNKASLVGGYVQNKFKLFKGRLHFLPGIRASYFETTGKFYYEPRMSFSYKISERFNLKGAYGDYYQFANRVTREDILSGSKDFWLLSDGESVPVSSSTHYIAGLSYESNKYLLSAEAYYKDVYDITEYSLRINPRPDGVSYDENFYSGNGYARGIEFLAQKKGGDLSGWLSYTLGEARNYFSVYSGDYYPANQDVTHEFKAVNMYKYKRWNFTATWVYATGRPYTAPSGAYSIELLDGNTQDFFTVTAKNGLRLPDYHRGDISATYKLLDGEQGDKRRREIGTLSFSIFNIYNKTNVWYKTYSIEEGSVIENSVTYTGITPNVTLSLKLW